MRRGDDVDRAGSQKKKKAKIKNRTASNDNNQMEVDSCAAATKNLHHVDNESMRGVHARHLVVHAKDYLCDAHSETFYVADREQTTISSAQR